MKVRVNETDLNGKPIYDSGEILSGENHLDIVEGMKIAPFTVNLEPLPYMRDVLARTGSPGFPLPDEPEAAAKAFLLKLAASGFVQFLEDDPYPPNLMEVLESIRQSGKTNMLDVPMVVKLALEMDEAEVANWVNTHRRDYGEIILHGRHPNPEPAEVK
ncbi:MAG: DUF5049 domain-containing protein [Victivallaceae bacterium]|nr:DUF5049 domain-containing protein [Victivallaceae bacterium]